MDLENAACDAMPYRAADILPNHASLAGIIAGFAIAGFVLYIAPIHPKDRKSYGEGHATAAMLFALAGIVGLIAAYMFSSVSGDHCLLANVEIPYPSVLLVLAGLLMVAAITAATSAAGEDLRQTSVAARLFTYGLGGLLMVRLAFDIGYSASLARGLRAAGITSLVGMEDKLAGIADDEPESDPGGVIARRILEGDVGPGNRAVIIAVVALAGVATVFGVAWRRRRPDSWIGSPGRWRQVTALTTVLVTFGLATLFSIDAEDGRRIWHDNPARPAVLLLSQAAVTVLILAGPLGPGVLGTRSYSNRSDSGEE